MLDAARTAESTAVSPAPETVPIIIGAELTFVGFVDSVNQAEPWVDSTSLVPSQEPPQPRWFIP